MVIPMALAAIAAGADGLILEVHPNPTKALSDGAQSLTIEQFGELMRKLEPVAAAVGRKLYHPPSQSELLVTTEAQGYM
jgi:3-deoxy-D-arabinoheptulosonate-7-phosphate synthase (EC 2.5.1.54)